MEKALFGTVSVLWPINYKTINWMSIGRKCLKTYTHPVGFDLIL